MFLIRRLSPSVIDQIAAGEVLERPANLVKELVENSLDAGAKFIEVHVSDGGRKIEVCDDGHGIAAEDLALALERHATSKIQSAEDLWALSSFGFRGEALASAAAVSHLTVVSRRRDDPEAHKLTSEFGVLGEVLPTGGEVGTRVRVEGLFENVPARLKFLRAASAEISQIKKTLKAFGLSNPKVTFRLFQNGEFVVHWEAKEDWKDRVHQVLEVSDLIESSKKSEDGDVTAFFSSPSHVEKTSQNIWLFVNGRWIQDRSLQAAIMQAYHNLLMHGEWPTAVVFLNVPTDSVDVNVHPSKVQVKFVEPRKPFRLIHSTLRERLEQAPWLERLQSDTTLTGQPPLLRRVSEEPFGPSEQSTFIPSSPTVFRNKQWESNAPQVSVSDIERAADRQSFLGSPSSSPAPAPAPTTPEIIKPLWGGLQILGQAGLTYIVAQSQRGLMVVDQHAAHERVMFERLLKDWKSQKPEVQNYLIPLTLTLEPAAIEAILSQAADLKTIGVEVERGGPDTILVLSGPLMVKDSALPQLLDRLSRDVLENGESFSFENSVRDRLASMACHSVVRAGQALSREEMKSLLEQMDEFSLSSFCPHGRPVFVEYSFRELDSDFSRIV